MSTQPSPEANLWHFICHAVSSIFTSPTIAPLAETAMDVGLAATGSGAAIPAANQAFAGAGELVQSVAAYKAANPGQPVTMDAVRAHLQFSDQTLKQADAITELFAPKVAAQMAKAVVDAAGVVVGGVKPADGPGPPNH